MTTTTAVPPNFTPIDLKSAREILADALGQAAALDGTAMGDTRTEVAEVNRKLLHLADDLMLASTLVRNTYWAARGDHSYEL